MDLAPFNDKSFRNFFLAMKVELPENMKLVKVRERLKSRADEVLLARINDKSGVLDYNVAITAESVPDKVTYGGFDKGFRVYVLNKPKEVAVDDGPKYSPMYDYDDHNLDKSESTNNVNFTHNVDSTFSFNGQNVASSSSSSIHPTLALHSVVPSTQPAATTTVNTAEMHYDNLKRDRDKRHESQIFHLRSLNNFIKNEIISMCIQTMKNRGSHSQGLRVLDIACGKGGDFKKWTSANSSSGGGGEVKEYMGVDIAKGSLGDFIGRLQGGLLRGVRPDLKITLVCADLNTHQLQHHSLPTYNWGGPGWETKIPLPRQSQPATPVFDIVSCQFALHYFFGGEKGADSGNSEGNGLGGIGSLFFLLSRTLPPGGIFAATTVDARVLCDYLLYVLHAGGEGTADRPWLRGSRLPGGGVEMHIHSLLDHPLLTITLPAETVRYLVEGEASSEDDGLGLLYYFSLRDSPQEKAVDAPEYICPLTPPSPRVSHVLRKLGLTLLPPINFHALLHRIGRDHGARGEEARRLMGEMGVWNVEKSVDPGEWAIARLYMAIFVKKNEEGASPGTTVEDTLSSLYPNIFAPQATRNDTYHEEIHVHTVAPAERVSVPLNELVEDVVPEKWEREVLWQSVGGCTPPSSSSDSLPNVALPANLSCLLKGMAPPSHPPPLHTPSQHRRAAATSYHRLYFPSLWEKGDTIGYSGSDLSLLAHLQRGLTTKRRKVVSAEEDTPHVMDVETPQLVEESISLEALLSQDFSVLSEDEKYDKAGEIARAMVGGQEQWDELPEEQSEELMNKALQIVGLVENDTQDN
eukprot:gene32023-38723_t